MSPARAGRSFPGAGVAWLLPVVVAMLPVLAEPSRAAVVRDAETEALLRGLVEPLFAAGGMAAGQAEPVILNDHVPNAFVTSSRELYVNTGLILELGSVGELEGVLAHEVGHIQGKHPAIARTRIARAQGLHLSAVALASALAVGSGRVDAGIGLALASEHMLVRSLLSYSRSQEAFADQAAVTLLERTGSPPQGLLDALVRFSRMESLAAIDSGGDAYIRPHPLTSQRISALEARLRDVPRVRERPERELAFALVQAKLSGFLEPFGRVMARYPDAGGMAARYGRSVALFRSARHDEALALLDQLIASDPRNPYFQELRGEILSDAGRLAEAVAAYGKAVALRPDEPMFLWARGAARLATERADLLDAAIGDLRRFLQAEPRNADGWVHLARAHGRRKEILPARLATAEALLAGGEEDEARVHARWVMDNSPPGSPAFLRAGDIIMQLDLSRDEKGG